MYRYHSLRRPAIDDIVGRSGGPFNQPLAKLTGPFSSRNLRARHCTAATHGLEKRVIWHQLAEWV